MIVHRDRVGDAAERRLTASSKRGFPKRRACAGVERYVTFTDDDWFAMFRTNAYIFGERVNEILGSGNGSKIRRADRFFSFWHGASLQNNERCTTVETCMLASR